jgi:hypothetical protein
MSIVAPLLTILVALGARLILEQSEYFQRHAKTLPPMPLGY